MNEIDLIYDSLCGQLIPSVAIPWVENAFAPGEPCAELYGEMLDAYQSLCKRLGRLHDDEDVEIIINSLLDMQEILCKKMFHYGMIYGKRAEM